MKSLNTIAKISALSVLAIAPVLTSLSPAFADTKGTDATYVGAGVSAGVTRSGQPGGEATFGGNIQGRAALPNVPVSARGTVNFTDKNSSVMPILTYDVPIANNTNLYVGGGYNFVQNQGVATPLGNKNAPVVTAGVETQIGQNVILYGDTKIGINAFQNSSATAASINAGAGLRF